MRWSVFGLLGGVALSLLRAPGGFDVFEPFVVGASTRYGVRALALCVLGLAFTSHGALRLRDTLLVLLCGFIGYALHGPVLAEALVAGSRGALVGYALMGTLALIVLRPRAPREAAASARTPDTGGTAERGAQRDDPAPRATWLELLGLLVAGTGTAIAVEAVARHARLLSDGSSRDDSVQGGVFLLLLLIGGAAFGGLARARWVRGLSLPVLACAGAAAALAGLRVLGNLASARGLDRYFRHPLLEGSGVDTSHHGTLLYDAWIGGSSFVLIAFALGAALAAASRRSQVAALLFGAAFGHRLVPRLFDDPTLRGLVEETRQTPDLVPIGIAIAAAGALLALATRRGPATARLSGALVVIALALLPRFASQDPQPAAAPWERVPPEPRLVHETADGVFTLEGGALGLEALTLGRRHLTPTFGGARADRVRIERAVEQCPPEARARGLRVLLVGQLTPGRALTLTELGAARIDRTGAWWRAMGRLEEDLFGAAGRPQGECIAPGEARRRAERSDYDLVLVPPVPGDLPPRPASFEDRTRRVGGAATVFVAWFDLASPAAGLDFGREGLLSADGLDALALGLVWDGRAKPAQASRELTPGRVRLGKPDLPQLPLRWLALRAEPRAYEALARTTDRLARAALGTPHEGLLAALAAFYAAQEISSPFADPADKVELPLETLARLRESSGVASDPEHAATGELDPFERGVWEGIARLLVAKRWIPETFETLGPIAQARRPWPELQLALAHASLESFEAEQALAWLAGTTEAAPDDVRGWLYRGEALSQLGRPAEAAASFERALAARPGRREVERALAMELCRAGDPRCSERVAALLAESPEDAQLARFLESPPPPVEPGFRPELFRPVHGH